MIKTSQDSETAPSGADDLVPRSCRLWAR